MVAFRREGGGGNSLLSYFTSDFKTKFRVKIRFKYIFKEAVIPRRKLMPK